ncbi:Peptidase S10 serine carboxypeptidase [Penicillium robsamsonii]|uniref:Peptidase S10 serine carboxypeptidase n=1 Tax=Penicillium robsamsonii TaxID=1792511 RepID=UPI002548C1EF|nr:Peptidase S10 serine carboxypeptidase [Penicillium robsamsonii]KAJ5817062.1 Peptidase S10 serine carboxypeptidase [Penicillium robsamsonii]
MLVLAPFVLLVVAVAALQNPHRKAASFKQPSKSLRKREVSAVRTEHQYLNKKTEKFAVNGTHFPQVPFDIGESYAGLLSNTPAGNSSLFFWFFPSTNPAADKEITVWLNGGPGCSSLDGLLQENGPFLWQSGVYEPVRNPYSWTNLTNLVYIDQPASTGFSPGPSTVKNEIDISNQFNDFWVNFIETFSMQGYKVYLTGESYAGQYIPYLAEGMLNRNDKKHFNLKGIQINDPSINDDSVLIYAPAVAALNHYSSVFALNETFMTEINHRADKCGYTDFLEKALTYPPPKNFPTAPDPNTPGCDVWDDIIKAATYVNPCFNIYHLTDFCPFLWDEMGFPSLAGGRNNYFNSSAVQAALNIPPTNYAVCGGDIFENGDGSVPSALGPLPSVIERTNNVLIGHGWYDYLLFANGTLATIQNMTWNGAQGFQRPPDGPLFVPYTDALEAIANGVVGSPWNYDAGGGILGTAHTERGLTFSSVYTAGHEIPQYTPGAAYRHLEFLLGRIKNLQQKEPFTTL